MAPPRWLIEAARRERQELSLAQQIVWGLVRTHRSGVKFRRQHPVRVGGRETILDFCSPRAKLVIETGTEPMGAERRERLEAAGFRVWWVHDDTVITPRFPELLEEFVTAS